MGILILLEDTRGCAKGKIHVSTIFSNENIPCVLLISQYKSL